MCDASAGITLRNEQEDEKSAVLPPAQAEDTAGTNRRHGPSVQSKAMPSLTA